MLPPTPAQVSQLLPPAPGSTAFTIVTAVDPRYQTAFTLGLRLHGTQVEVDAVPILDATYGEDAILIASATYDEDAGREEAVLQLELPATATPNARAVPDVDAEREDARNDSEPPLGATEGLDHTRLLFGLLVLAGLGLLVLAVLAICIPRLVCPGIVRRHWRGSL